MHEYNGFTEKLRDELSDLQKLRFELNQNVDKKVEGTLNIACKKGKKPQYYIHVGHHKRIYISNSEKEKIKGLAQHSYSQEALKRIDERIEAGKKLLKTYDASVEGIYEKMSCERKELITPIIIPEKTFVENWINNNPGGKNTYPITNVSYTDRGEAVRSKSERTIANMLNKYDVPYSYEPQLLLDNGKMVFPDFIALNRRLRKPIIWEHFGIMSDGNYSARVAEKIAAYENCGYWPGDTLVFSMETQNQAVDARLIEKMVIKYFL